MPQSECIRRNPTQFSFLTRTKPRFILSVLALLQAGFLCMAQEQSSTPQSSMPNTQAIENNNLRVPSGTRIALVLTQPIRSRNMHRGDGVYAQITSPVTSDTHVLIPTGTFVQGKLDTVNLVRGRGELHLQAASILFPGGYVAHVLAPLTLESSEGYAIRDSGKGRMIGAMVLPFAGLGLGTAVGHAVGGDGTNDNLRMSPPGRIGDMAIGSMVGLVVGGVASLVMLSYSHNFFLDAGSPVEMVLQQPLLLDRDSVAAAILQPNISPVQKVSKRPQATFPASADRSPIDCIAGQEHCNGSCMDTADFMSDSSNCGRCGNMCSIGESCVGGTCMENTP